MRFLKNPRIVVPAALAIAALAWLAFGYFAVHTRFIDDNVDEAVPTFAPQITIAPQATTAPPDATTVGATTVVVLVTTTVAQPQVVTEAMGTFVSLDHDTSGTASVLGDGSGVRFLRIEDLNTSNGPDLNVYLVNSSTGDVSDFIDLGELKGNVGDQNYEIPVGADLATYNKVVIWCVRFSSPFGEATLQPVTPV